jgi:hypothetical protein
MEVPLVELMSSAVPTRIELVLTLAGGDEDLTVNARGNLGKHILRLQNPTAQARRPNLRFGKKSLHWPGER